jgi:hypothetical protein
LTRRIRRGPGRERDLLLFARIIVLGCAAARFWPITLVILPVSRAGGAATALLLIYYSRDRLRFLLG